MDKLILKGICEILENRSDILSIAIKQRAKFEGWLKFELAGFLSNHPNITEVNVESKIGENSRSDTDGYGDENSDPESKIGKNSRCDISFKEEDKTFYLELKTPNTNWRCEGVDNRDIPITKNIQSIIDDVEKLTNHNGIIAFVLFPIPINHDGWNAIINYIEKETNLTIDRNQNCKEIEINIGENSNKVKLLICAFKTIST